MRISEFADGLFQQIETQKDELHLNDLHDLAKKQCANLLSLLSELRAFAVKYDFENSAEEIDFFKNVKVRFLRKLIYYQKLFQIWSSQPAGLPEEKNNYFLNELKIIREFRNDNREFLTYYKSGSVLLDEIYFTRKKTDLWLSLSYDEYENDPAFTTIYDHKLSRLLAYGDLSDVIIERMNSLHTTNDTENDKAQVTWTASKASLIELLYAIQSSGCCNNGSLEVKQLAVHFERLFNVKLGNYYRTFQEIRIRKISRTTFLDLLKESLVKRMDNSDENPRF